MPNSNTDIRKLICLLFSVIWLSGSDMARAQEPAEKVSLPAPGDADGEILEPDGSSDGPLEASEADEPTPLTPSGQILRIQILEDSR
ncbi:MAG: hypothetical protein VW202_06085, partial [Halieaceae bacterium]